MKTKAIFNSWLLILLFFISASGQQTAEEWFSTGLALYYQHKYDEAIQAYDRAIKTNPQFADAWRSKGIALVVQGKYDEAILAYDKVIEIDPEDAHAWDLKGLALAAEGWDRINQSKYNEAISAFDKAIDLDPQYTNAWVHKGQVLKDLGRITEADAAFNKAKELGYTGGLPLYVMDRIA